MNIFFLIKGSIGMIFCLYSLGILKQKVVKASEALDVSGRRTRRPKVSLQAAGAVAGAVRPRTLPCSCHFSAQHSVLTALRLTKSFITFCRPVLIPKGLWAQPNLNHLEWECLASSVCDGGRDGRRSSSRRLVRAQTRFDRGR